jgi:transposase InsO family protein
VCGKTRTKSTYGEQYFMLIFDCYKRLIWVFFLKEKYEAFEKFKIYKSLVENETDLKIKCISLDNGGEFTSKEFIQLCENHDIKR